MLGHRQRCCRRCADMLVTLNIACIHKCLYGVEIRVKRTFASVPEEKLRLLATQNAPTRSCRQRPTRVLPTDKTKLKPGLRVIYGCKPPSCPQRCWSGRSSCCWFGQRWRPWPCTPWCSGPADRSCGFQVSSAPRWSSWAISKRCQRAPGLPAAFRPLLLLDAGIGHAHGLMTLKNHGDGQTLALHAQNSGGGVFLHVQNTHLCKTPLTTS